MHRVLGAHEACRRERVAARALGGALSGGGLGAHRVPLGGGLCGLGDGGHLHVPPATVEGELDRVTHLVRVRVRVQVGVRARDEG